MRRGYDTPAKAEAAAPIIKRRLQSRGPVGHTVEEAPGGGFMVRVTFVDGRIQDCFPAPLVVG